MMSEASGNFTREIGAMFGRIAPRYDLLNRFMTAGLDQKWRRETVRRLSVQSPAPRLLDLATGTADLALAIFAEYPGRMIRVDAVDLSQEMLALAEKKTKERNLQDHLHLHCASIENLPFADDAFDGATIGFGIRNVENREKGLREIHRVLKPGAKLAILEAVPPQHLWQRFFQRLHMIFFVRLLGIFFSEGKAYRYLGESVAQFPPAGEFVAMMTRAGFRECAFRTLGFGAATIFCGVK